MAAVSWIMQTATALFYPSNYILCQICFVYLTLKNSDRGLKHPCVHAAFMSCDLLHYNNIISQFIKRMKTDVSWEQEPVKLFNVNTDRKISAHFKSSSLSLYLIQTVREAQWDVYIKWDHHETSQNRLILLTWHEHRQTQRGELLSLA